MGCLAAVVLMYDSIVLPLDELSEQRSDRRNPSYQRYVWGKGLDNPNLVSQ